MKLENIIKPVKKFGISSLLIASLAFNPLYARAEDFPNYNKKKDIEEKVLIGSYIALNLIDTYQTINMPKGIEEGNPLVSSWAGKRPSAGEVILYKTVMMAGFFYLYNQIPKHTDNKKIPKYLLRCANAFQLSVDLYNEKITGGILFKKTF